MTSPFQPCCPCGVDCPCCLNSPDEWIIDLGATGAFTNNRCNQCSNIGGEYTLVRTAENESVPGCRWIYCANNLCPDSDPNCDKDWDLKLTLDMIRPFGASDCDYRLFIMMRNGVCVFEGDDPVGCLKIFTIREYLLNSGVGSLHCIDDLDISLPLVSEQAGDACGGTPNDPITLKAA